MDWYRQAYEDQAPARAAAEQRAQAVSDAQLEGMNFAIQQARDLDEYNRTTFRPLEQAIVEEAKAYDTPERRAAAAMSAGADVDASATAVRESNERALARSGAAPGSAKALAIAEDMANRQVSTRAGAMTGAVRNVEAQGYARRADAANLGRNIASNQATQQQIASNTGTAAVSNSAAGLQAAMSGNSVMQQGFSNAMNANQSAGNLYTQVANIARQEDSDMLGGITSLVGTGARLWASSDEKLKKNTGKKANTASSLKKIEQTPVEDGWEYDPSKGGPDDGGAKHIGPMHQSVRKTMGPEAASDEGKVDLVNMNGHMMAAIQELSKRIKSLEKGAA